MYNQFAAVIIFIFVAIAFVVGSMIMGAIIRRSKKSAAKEAIYECGEPTIGPAWVRYNNRFYNIALVYLLFDVEVVVLIPAALALKGMAGTSAALVGVIGLLVFIAVLVVGLAYEWFCGNLNWIRNESGSK